MLNTSKNKPLVSIIIPTRNSSSHLRVLLPSIEKQKFKNVEVIIADNNSVDETPRVAKEYNAKVVNVNGTAPQVAKQRNMGARIASGVYLYFVDHDMELSSNFLESFSERIKVKKYSEIDAWYVPERIISRSKFLSTVRNFEGKFIDGTVVSAARLIKRKAFFATNQYEEQLSGGPADWDLDIQLKLLNLQFAILNKVVYHHEENLSVWRYIFKKTTYIKGEEIYKKKWRDNAEVYNNIINKQYNLRYRIFWLFVEDNKWKKLLLQLDKYLLFLLVKLSLVVVYVYWRKRYVK